MSESIEPTGGQDVSPYRFSRDVRSRAVFGEDGMCRGWVHLDADRPVGRPTFTAFCVVIETSGFLSPFEARAFATALHAQADKADRLLDRRKKEER